MAVEAVTVTSTTHREVTVELTDEDEVYLTAGVTIIGVQLGYLLSAISALKQGHDIAAGTSYTYSFIT